MESDEYLLPEIDYENLQNSDESEVEDENDWEIDTDYSQLDMEVVRQLPTDIQTEIAEQLKEKSNFTDPDDLPENLDEFSQFQLEKLLQKTRVKQQLRSALNETNHGNKEDILLALDDANGGEQKKFTNSLMDRYKNAELKVEMGRNSSDSKSGFVLIKKKPDQVPFRASKTASFPVESSSQPAVDNTSSKTAAIGASEDLNRSFLSDDEEQSDEESEIQLKKVVEKTTSPYFESNKIECENLSSSSDEGKFITTIASYLCA